MMHYAFARMSLARTPFARMLGAAVLLLISAIAPAVAADKVRAGKAVPFAWTFTPLEVGVEAGIFARNGLEVEITSFGGDAKLQQAMAADGIDVGLGSGPGMAFQVKGAPVRAVAAMAGLPKNIAIIVSYNSPVKSLADLKGKRIGVTTVGSLTEWLAKRMAVLQGWGPNGVVATAVGGMEPSKAALKTGEIDALVTSLETGYALEEAREWRVLAPTGGFVDHFITHVIYARKSLVDAKPELVGRFLKGWFETIAWMAANREATVRITAAALNLSPGVIGRVYDEEIGMFSRDGVFDPKAVEVLKQSFLDMALLKEKPGDTALFTTQFVPVAVPAGK